MDGGRKGDSVSRRRLFQRQNAVDIPESIVTLESSESDSTAFHDGTDSMQSKWFLPMRNLFLQTKNSELFPHELMS